MTAQMLEGRLSIQAALTAGSREIQQLLLDDAKRYDWSLSQLARQADAAGIPISYRPRAVIDKQAGGSSHGGILALVGERRTTSLESLLEVDSPAFIVMLDGIEDPYNFGGAVRAIYTAGAQGLVVRPRNWGKSTAIIGRASAGASERIKMAVAQNAAEAAEVFQARGLVIAQTANDAAAMSLFAADLTQPLFLLIGGERRGLTRSVLQRADMQLRIPYGREFPGSLGTISAAAILAFEVLRQRS
ncbi:MAG: RNA methyltransferase [Chloroflexi bacterium]|nr:RNA methyltransferase [Chloroflexota bacterium]MCY3581041.1 RNA methyltransferase [Chloroflexota bacterium]MCY3715230.1 RNA methyltransferase [Chloroflexota bacterium]MDE2650001.1 RNA methyltransferase [Chloroflexota bacterium]MXV92567.1 RNA methyltransferase [Chloroflexota bacterium]